ncbi:DUF4062 domain-containing protein [Pseudomonas sp. MD195_PC81_125]|nr:DUF4062 domain-containing protein [Pseudomonas sp. MD195_PC81_125]
MEERKSVTQTLMEMDCIPAGMEMFPATDEEQWVFIKKVIDDCDYYLLIVGGRYGSLGAEGLSFTEMEFDYAVERGIKIVALLHGSPEKLTIERSEISEEARLKLQAFRDKVSNGRLVKYWTSPSDLPGLVSLSLVKTMKAFPAVGWVRASEGSNEGLLKEINELRKENDRLNLEVSQIRNRKKAIYDVPNLAGFGDMYSLFGSFWDGINTRPWKADCTWGEIFYYISPYLVNGSKESAVKDVLLEALCTKLGFGTYMSSLRDQDFQTVAISKCKALLGVVAVVASDTTSDIADPQWLLTSDGERMMVETRAVRKLILN